MSHSVKSNGREKFPREEWDSSNLLPDELTIAVWWEYLREIPEAISAVQAWRRIPKNRPAKNGFKRARAGDDELDIFWSLPFAFDGDPEWPDTPFSALPRVQRSEIVARLGNPEDPQPLMEISVGEICEMFSLGAGHSLNDWIRRRVFTEYRVSRIQIAAFAIDWTLSNESLAQAFAAWLVSERPRNIVAEESRGAGSRARQIRKLLKALGAFRLLRVMPWQKAFDHTYQAAGKPLFSELEHCWKRPASAAKKKIETIHQMLNRTQLPGDFYRLMEELGAHSKESA